MKNKLIFLGYFLLSTLFSRFVAGIFAAIALLCVATITILYFTITPLSEQDLAAKYSHIDLNKCHVIGTFKETQNKYYVQCQQ